MDDFLHMSNSNLDKSHATVKNKQYDYYKSNIGIDYFNRYPFYYAKEDPVDSVTSLTKRSTIYSKI